jgi:hypothetical protein
VTHQKSHLSPEDRLPSSLISFIHASDTVFFGTTYAASFYIPLAPWHESARRPTRLRARPAFRRAYSRSPRLFRYACLPTTSPGTDSITGNRLMTSLGNIEATPLASLTFYLFRQRCNPVPYRLCLQPLRRARPCPLTLPGTGNDRHCRRVYICGRCPTRETDTRKRGRAKPVQPASTITCRRAGGTKIIEY